MTDTAIHLEVLSPATSEDVPEWLRAFLAREESAGSKGGSGDATIFFGGVDEPDRSGVEVLINAARKRTPAICLLKRERVVRQSDEPSPFKDVADRIRVYYPNLVGEIPLFFSAETGQQDIEDVIRTFRGVSNALAALNCMESCIERVVGRCRLVPAGGMSLRRALIAKVVESEIAQMRTTLERVKNGHILSVMLAIKSKAYKMRVEAKHFGEVVVETEKIELQDSLHRAWCESLKEKLAPWGKSNLPKGVRQQADNVIAALEDPARNNEVVLVGEFSTGKTTLARMLLGAQEDEWLKAVLKVRRGHNTAATFIFYHRGTGERRINLSWARTAGEVEIRLLAATVQLDTRDMFAVSVEQAEREKLSDRSMIRVVVRTGDGEDEGAKEVLRIKAPSDEIRLQQWCEDCLHPKVRGLLAGAERREHLGGDAIVNEKRTQELWAVWGCPVCDESDGYSAAMHLENFCSGQVKLKVLEHQRGDGRRRKEARAARDVRVHTVSWSAFARMRSLWDKRGREGAPKDNAGRAIIEASYVPNMQKLRRNKRLMPASIKDPRNFDFEAKHVPFLLQEARVYMDHDLLTRVSLRDTPGLNSVTGRHDEVTAEAIRRGSYFLVVTSQRKTMGSATGQALTLIKHRLDELSIEGSDAPDYSKRMGILVNYTDKGEVDRTILDVFVKARDNIFGEGVVPVFVTDLLGRREGGQAKEVTLYSLAEGYKGGEEMISWLDDLCSDCANNARMQIARDVSRLLSYFSKYRKLLGREIADKKVLVGGLESAAKGLLKSSGGVFSNSSNVADLRTGLKDLKATMKTLRSGAVIEKWCDLDGKVDWGISKEAGRLEESWAEYVGDGASRDAQWSNVLDCVRSRMKEYIRSCIGGARAERRKKSAVVSPVWEILDAKRLVPLGTAATEVRARFGSVQVPIEKLSERTFDGRMSRLQKKARREYCKRNGLGGLLWFVKSGFKDRRAALEEIGREAWEKWTGLIETAEEQLAEYALELDEWASGRMNRLACELRGQVDEVNAGCQDEEREMLDEAARTFVRRTREWVNSQERSSGSRK